MKYYPTEPDRHRRCTRLRDWRWDRGSADSRLRRHHHGLVAQPGGTVRIIDAEGGAVCKKGEQTGPGTRPDSPAPTASPATRW